MKGYVYKITSPSTDKIYIGSTVALLSTRLSNHKSSKNCASREILINDDAIIELLEEIDFMDMKELRLVERRYYDLNVENCVNYYRPIITEEERTIKKKECNEINKHIIKEWRVNNNEKIECKCGGKYLRQHKSTHFKTAKHQKYLMSV
jgi:hypothetical protein